MNKKIISCSDEELRRASSWHTCADAYRGQLIHTDYRVFIRLIRVSGFCN